MPCIIYEHSPSSGNDSLEVENEDKVNSAATGKIASENSSNVDSDRTAGTTEVRIFCSTPKSSHPFEVGAANGKDYKLNNNDNLSRNFEKEVNEINAIASASPTESSISVKTSAPNEQNPEVNSQYSELSGTDIHVPNITTPDIACKVDLPPIVYSSSPESNKSSEDISEPPESYEELIKRNIREKNRMLGLIFKDVDFNEFKVAPKNVPKRLPKTYTKTSPKILPPVQRRLLPRRASKSASNRLPPEDYSDEEVVDFSDDEEIMVNGRKRKLVIAPRQRAKRRNITTTVEEREIVAAEDITEQDLRNVADIVTEKVYSQSGTTCHQCRQKTTDMKTICRSNSCLGVRGYFCGPCLRNRYGEDARAALKDPTWTCPPCRLICNCSICRNRAGAGATGILTPLAKRFGYASVKEYLDDHDTFVIKYEDENS